MSPTHTYAPHQHMARVLMAAISEDGLLGYDQHNQLLAGQVNSDEVTYRIVPDLRAKTCAICGRGWELSSESFLNYANLDKLGFAHRNCYRGHLQIAEFNYWHQAFIDANLVPFQIETIDCQYIRTYNLNWYQVHLTTYQGQNRPRSGLSFVVGPRHRVRSIELMGLKVPGERFDYCTSTKEHTHNGYLVHSWNEAETLTHLKTFRDIILETFPGFHQNGFPGIFAQPEANVA